jgi:hypothetical protein
MSLDLYRSFDVASRAERDGEAHEHPAGAAVLDAKVVFHAIELLEPRTGIGDADPFARF